MLAGPDGGLIRPLTHRMMQRVAHGDFDGGMPLNAARKDSTLALAMAQDGHVPLFATQAAHTVYDLAVARGLGRRLRRAGHAVGAVGRHVARLPVRGADVNRTTSGVFALQYASRSVWVRGEHFHGYTPTCHEQYPIDYYIWAICRPDDVVVVNAGFTRQAALERGNRAYLADPSELLGLLGRSVDEVSTLVLSHLHYDHTGHVAGFPNAQIHVQRHEHEFWNGRSPTAACSTTCTPPRTSSRSTPSSTTVEWCSMTATSPSTRRCRCTSSAVTRRACRSSRSSPTMAPSCSPPTRRTSTRTSRRTSPTRS